MKKPLRDLILPMAREQLIQAREPTAIAFQVEEHRQGASFQSIILPDLTLRRPCWSEPTRSSNDPQSRGRCTAAAHWVGSFIVHPHRESHVSRLRWPGRPMIRSLSGLLSHMRCSPNGDECKALGAANSLAYSQAEQRCRRAVLPQRGGTGRFGGNSVVAGRLQWAGIAARPAPRTAHQSASVAYATVSPTDS